LQPLHQIGGAHEEYAPTAFDESKAERCRQVTLSGARWMLYVPPPVPDVVGRAVAGAAVAAIAAIALAAVRRRNDRS
jgi:hypothetical protein